MFENTRTVTSFSVDDIPAAARFYGGTLGVKCSEESGILWLHLADGILIYPKPDHIPASYTVLNFVVEDIDDAVDELIGRGVRLLRYDGLGLDEKGVVRAPDRDIAWFTDPCRQRSLRIPAQDSLTARGLMMAGTRSVDCGPDRQDRMGNRV